MTDDLKRKSTFFLFPSSGGSVALGEMTLEDARSAASKRSEEDEGVRLTEVGVGEISFQKVKKNGKC